MTTDSTTTVPTTTTLETTAPALALAPGRWTLDTMHSTVSFWIRHLGVSKVRGRFNRFDAAIDAGATVDEVRVTATIDAASIDTGNADRDAHLRTADFLDVARFPELTFVSTAITGEGDRWTMTGDLTIADQTRPVSFAVELGGISEPLDVPPGHPLHGQRHGGFAAEGKIDRRHFDLQWSLPPGASTVLGDVIHFELDLQFVAPAAG
jgi:polyisoprenoid-binding protein YceI